MSYRRPVRRTVVENGSGPNMILVVLVVLVALLLIWLLFFRGGAGDPIGTEDQRETTVEQDQGEDAPDINIQVPVPGGEAETGNEGGGNEQPGQNPAPASS